MKFFWKWMEENDYGDNLSQKGEDLYGYGFYPPHQMLIGYMIEYLLENDKLNFSSNTNNIIEEYYNWLQFKIKEISNAKEKK